MWRGHCRTGSSGVAGLGLIGFCSAGGGCDMSELQTLVHTNAADLITSIDQLRLVLLAITDDMAVRMAAIA